MSGPLVASWSTSSLALLGVLLLSVRRRDLSERWIAWLPLPVLALFITIAANDPYLVTATSLVLLGYEVWGLTILRSRHRSGGK